MSHSCKDGLVAYPPAAIDPVKLARLRFALAVRSALVARLDPGGAGDGTGAVWFDRKRLEPGDDWELDIVGALHTCEGAVLLLTPDALESPWVLREATVLGDRRSRWPDLRLVPVLLAGTTHESLGKHPWWAALGITRWQPVQAPQGAFEGSGGDSDLAWIVDQVAAKLGALNRPKDPALDRWAQDVSAFLAELARKGLKARLDGAARVLHLKAPLRWEQHELDSLARALLHTDVAEVGPAGEMRFPLVLALSHLVPDDPGIRPREQAEQALCLRMQPLAAPPGAAVAIGSARVVEAGQRPMSVLLGADDASLAQLAVRRATCGDALIRSLTGVAGEAAVIPPDSAKTIDDFARRAARLDKPFYVVTSLDPLAGDDLDAVALGLAGQLPAGAALVGVIGRDPVAPAHVGDGTVVVVVPAADEAAALTVADDLDYLSGKT